MTSSQPFGGGGGPSLPGRLSFSGYGIQTEYSGARFLSSRGLPGSYGLVGGLQGYREGAGGYLGPDGQFVGVVGYDGYIDDSGLGMEGHCGTRGDVVDCGNRGGQDKPIISVDPPHELSPQEEVKVEVCYDAGQEKVAEKIVCVESPDQEQVVVGQHLGVKDDVGATAAAVGQKDIVSPCSSPSSMTNSDSEKDE